MKPKHTTKQLRSWCPSVHRLLTYVYAVHKDFAVGRFKVPAAGCECNQKTAQGRNWFSRKHPDG